MSGAGGSIRINRIISRYTLLRSFSDTYKFVNILKYIGIYFVIKKSVRNFVRKIRGTFQ